MDELKKQQLIEGWFLGTLSDDESKTLEMLLLDDKNLRDDFRKASKVDALLKTRGEEASPSSENKKIKPLKTGKHKRLGTNRTKSLRRKRSTAKKSKSFPVVAFLAVAALLVISLGVFVLSQKAVQGPYLQVAEITLNGSVTVNGKETKGKDFKVNAGDTVLLPKGVTLKLKYPNENTFIELYENSDAQFINENGNKHIYLSSGKLKADVAAQTKGKNMYLITDQSKTTVLGTVFSLEAKQKSRLEVYEGKVQFESIISGKKVYVDGGYFSEAGSGINTEVNPLEIQYPNVYGMKVLYVGDKNDLSDRNPILLRLRKVGFTVRTVSDRGLVFEDTKNIDLLIMSASSTVGGLDNGIKGVAIPIISWHSSVFDNLGLVRFKENGEAGTKIKMTGSDHPLSAGLKGNVSLFNEVGNNISWGKPSMDAIVIATVGEDKTHASIFAYDRGDQMLEGRAKARRVALCYGESTRYKWTAAAWRLFDAAVLWSLALEPQ